jgi:hypothetical protein
VTILQFGITFAYLDKPEQINDNKMKARVYILVLILSMATTTGFSQDKSKRELKEERKLEKQKQIETMINTKEFIFVPRTALPSGMPSVNLSLNQNYVKFIPDLIDSYMPFFGSAYSIVGYGTDTGLSFKGQPKKFSIEKKGKLFQINVVVKGETDIFSLFLSVGSEGNASLSISSNNRSTISFEGEISALEKN